MRPVGRAGLRGAVAAACTAWVLAAVPAGAEIVHLTTGRAVFVRGYEREGGEAVLFLRAGGEVRCPASLIARIDPDEAPPAADTASPAAGAPADRIGRPFDALVRSAARQFALDPRLLHAVIRAESAYRPEARSPKGARGLMQLMPATLREYGVRDPEDPRANITAGARHLRRLLDRFPLDLALAAYNAGEGAVARYNGIPPFTETRAYVKQVLAAVGR